MTEPRLEFLFELTGLLDGGTYAIGETGSHNRTVVQVSGGSFEGPHLRGEVVPGGGDWYRVRSDGVVELDVRITLRTDDGALIYMWYPGLTHGESIGPDGQTADGGRYFRTTPRFETGSERYAWLNRILAVGAGVAGEPGQVRYRIYAIH
jgi:hypothetical protein